jgi:hypothetical protein
MVSFALGMAAREGGHPMGRERGAHAGGDHCRMSCTLAASVGVGSIFRAWEERGAASFIGRRNA